MVDMHIQCAETIHNNIPDTYIHQIKNKTY